MMVLTLASIDASVFGGSGADTLECLGSNLSSWATGLRQSGDVVFHVDGRNPLTTRLDHILGAVSEDDSAIMVDLCHIPGDEPSFVEFVGSIFVKVFTNYPGTTAQ